MDNNNDSNVRVILPGGFIPSILKERDALRAEVAQWKDGLQDPETVRLAILRGQIVIPPDLVWFYDDVGKVADLRAEVARLTGELAEDRAQRAILEELYNGQQTTMRELWAQNETLTQARDELSALREAARWIPVGERLPDLNEVQYSEYVQLAYRVVGCSYHGQQAVSRYHRVYHKTGQMDWEYHGGTLSEWGYEPVAWRPLPEPPEGRGE